MAGPLGAVCVGGLPFLFAWTKAPLVVRVFNTSLLSLVSAISAVVYIQCGGHTPLDQHLSPEILWVHCFIPLEIAIVAHFFLNISGVSLIISATSPQSWRAPFRRMVRDMWRIYLGYALVGFLIAVLWQVVDLGPITMIFMLVPLILAQWAYAQQSAEAQAHQRTVEGLVAAVETRDPVMRGRSVQAAAVCDVIGADFRLSPKEADALHFAALLHDLGMIAPVEEERGRDLSQLRPGDIDRIRRHPQRGVEMVRSIDFLADSTTAIRHHHERWDGHGFPSGLAGEEIPILARIIAVADAYCALSSDRAGEARRSTDEILTILRARAGSQFDPRCVDAIVRNAPTVTARLSQLHAVDDTADATAGHAGWDHDLPETSDLIAFGSALR
ncbi:HD-GYP domain-containing protein [Rudaeicoccus suwonensis]|uniref:HD domain-containing protein n=1 Tax=Rudaeicoccus suwonensis TaxID=657409 RepID=A0A561E1F4_9MICO|nr:HD domain-containing phosphohydrolase [Rudaeicoccus suwonensis]TWE09458.1 HD domain-containing protein [Rudaeicoccus suwonensis]